MTLIDLDAIVHTLTKKNIINDRSAPREAPLCMQLAQKPGHYHPAILKSAKYQLQSMSLLFCLSTIKGVSSFYLWKPTGHGRNPFDIQA